jgi:uncharacterized membrane protein
LKYLVFGFIGLVFLYVLGHNESFLVRPRDPVWHHYEPFKWWLLGHGVAGFCALLLVPLQFSDRLRQRYTKMHRVVGRIYIAGAFIAGSLGIYIKFFGERLGDTRSFTMAAVSHGGLWMLTSGIALALILQGKVQQHRQWMTRSIVVGPGVFLGARVILGLTGLESHGPATVETVVWMCVVFSVPLADIVLQCQELLRSRAAQPQVATAR